MKSGKQRKAPAPAGVETLTISDKKFKVDVVAECRIVDLDADMAEVAARIAYWGAVLGSAIEERDLCDARYRAWRAKINKAALEKDPKISEWKVKATIEADKTFMQYKTASAAAEHNVVTLTYLIKALMEKSPNLRSKGARERAELDATDMSTPSERTAAGHKRELRSQRDGR